MNKLPRTFCVTLKETPFRTKKFLEEADRVGIKAEIYHGIFGQRLGLASKMANDVETTEKNVYMTDGAVGCYLSHFILWKILQYMPEEEFLIVEDDAVFVDDFLDKFNKTYAQLPKDWEMVYVGWLPYGGIQTVTMVDEGISIRTPSATHAYLIKKEVLQTACTEVQPCYAPLDLTIIKKLLPKLKYYVFDPPLVTQRSYLNTSDAAWSSLIYDWKNDLYGCKKKFLSELTLLDGWYKPERNGDETWQWSKDKFVIQTPTNFETLSLLVSTPMANTLVVQTGGNTVEFSLASGYNVLPISTSGVSKIEGEMKTPFIPSKADPSSSDNRNLGICLRGITAKVGGVDVKVEIADLNPSVPQPHNFKL